MQMFPLSHFLALKTLLFLTGLLIVGEALALLVGMHLLSPAKNPWISWKNELLLGLDLLAGAGLIMTANRGEALVRSPLLTLLLAIVVLTHGYREGEYLATLPDAFCANLPLFVFNTLKLLGGVASVIVWLLSLKE